MPGYNCPIKERMLYSSCKNPLTDTITNLGLEIVKKVCWINPPNHILIGNTLLNIFS